MDKEAIRAKMRARFKTSIEAALEAVEVAPDGQWIAGSEWEVRDIVRKLTADSFQTLIQTRADEHSAALRKRLFPPPDGGANLRNKGRQR